MVWNYLQSNFYWADDWMKFIIFLDSSKTCFCQIVSFGFKNCRKLKKFHCSHFPPNQKKKIFLSHRISLQSQVFQQVSYRFKTCDICRLHGKIFCFVLINVKSPEEKLENLFIFENIMQSSNASKQEFFWLSSRISLGRRWKRRKRRSRNIMKSNKKRSLECAWNGAYMRKSRPVSRDGQTCIAVAIAM